MKLDEHSEFLTHVALPHLSEAEATTLLSHCVDLEFAFGCGQAFENFFFVKIVSALSNSLDSAAF